MTILRARPDLRKSRSVGGTRRARAPAGIALAASLAALGGCGGASSGAPASGVAATARAAASVADCLDSRYGFLAQARHGTLAGQSAGGVGFTLELFGTRSAALAAARRAHTQTTVAEANGVVRFGGNPPAYRGGPPARLSRKALVELRACIVRSTRSGDG